LGDPRRTQSPTCAWFVVGFKGWGDLSSQLPDRPDRSPEDSFQIPQTEVEERLTRA
jgi:hypothetical protein